MKTVSIHGTIGESWYDDDFTSKNTVEQDLKGLVSGEPVEVVVNSAGGSVYDAAVIFNIIYDVAKSHPVSTRINTIALSAASYIALAARAADKTSKITVRENSVLMIHNVWTFAIGDYRDMRREADLLEKLNDLYGSAHAVVSGKSLAEIRALMDVESWFVGKEIVDSEFASDFDALAPAPQANAAPFVPADREVLLKNARLHVARIRKSARKAQDSSELKRAVALFESGAPFAPANSINPAEPATVRCSAEKNVSQKTGAKMSPEELKANDAECYGAVFKLAHEAALAEERARISAHLELCKKLGDNALALKHIASGKKSTDADVVNEYMQAAIDKAQIDRRISDNPPDFSAVDASDSDAAAVGKAFALGTRGKTARGESWLM